MGRNITIGIQGKGSSTVLDVNIISDLLKSQTGIELQPILEDDKLLRLEWLKKGTIDLFYEGANAVSFFEGSRLEEIDRDRGPFQIRIVASAHTGTGGYIVRGDSPIKTIYDIGRNTRVAIRKGMSDQIMYALLSWLELNKGPILQSPEDCDWNVDLVYVDSWEANLRSVPEGKADVAWVTAENPLVKEAANDPHGIRFLELPAHEDPNGLERFRKINPVSKIAPAPEYGAKQIWGVNTTTGGGTACLWCRQDFDDNLGYDLTKWFDVNYESFKDKGNKLKTYTLESLRQTLTTAMAPIHDGTIRYFREKGLWSKEDDDRGEYNHKLLDWYCEAWSDAIAQADIQGIPVNSESNEWFQFWCDYKNQIHIPSIVQMNDQEITEGLRTLRNLGR